MVIYTNLDFTDMPNEIRKHLKSVKNKEYIKEHIEMERWYKTITYEEYKTLLREYCV